VNELDEPTRTDPRDNGKPGAIRRDDLRDDIANADRYA
jgi:hypothetical protein